MIPYNSIESDEVVGTLKDLFQNMEDDFDVDISISCYKDQGDILYVLGLEDIKNIGSEFSDQICKNINRSLIFGFGFGFLGKQSEDLVPGSGRSIAYIESSNDDISGGYVYYMDVFDDGISLLSYLDTIINRRFVRGIYLYLIYNG